MLLGGESFLKPLEGDCIAAIKEVAHLSGFVIDAETEADASDPSGFVTLGIEIDDGPHVSNRVRKRKSLRRLRDFEREHAHWLVA